MLEHPWLWILREIGSLAQSHRDLRASSMKTIRGHELGYALVQTVLIGGPAKINREFSVKSKHHAIRRNICSWFDEIFH